jgi:hypothetical protein
MTRLSLCELFTPLRLCVKKRSCRPSSTVNPSAPAPLAFLPAIGLVALLLTGCGGRRLDVAPVSGTVTLDGAPLKSASVTFQPKEGGRPSFGVTNEQGHYVLEYSLNELGAKVGACTVRITTENRSDDSGAKPTKELVPKRYFREPVEVQVEPKGNTIDIALTSK